MDDRFVQYKPCRIHMNGTDSVPKRRHIKFDARELPRKSIQHSEHGERLKSRIYTSLLPKLLKFYELPFWFWGSLWTDGIKYSGILKTYQIKLAWSHQIKCEGCNTMQNLGKAYKTLVLQHEPSNLSEIFLVSWYLSLYYLSLRHDHILPCPLQLYLHTHGK